ncbi:MAG: hypothetical protein RR619_12385, partial [Raoultibacter sp.]
MQLFSTDFPLATGTTPVQILEECLYWVSESPHTNFTQAELVKNISIEEFTKNNDNEKIEFEHTDDGELHIHSFIYTKRDDSHAWITSVSFLTIPSNGEAW